MLAHHHTRVFLLARVVFSTFLIVYPLRVISQMPDLTQRISVEYIDLPLEIILKDIAQKNEIEFSYSENIIPVNHKISYSAQNKVLEKVLNEIFLQAGIRYSIINGYLVLTIMKRDQTVNPTKKDVYTISGIIADSANHEILIGATVFIEEIGVGVNSNNYGFFSLSLPEGTYKLQTSYLGYSAEAKNIHLTSNLTWNIHLTSVPLQIKEIIINSVNVEELVYNSRAAQTNIDPLVVQKRSAVLGETDMLKSLDNLPGISFQSDGSSYFSVRGGERDQNLILLDEAPIYNPSHLLGLFTPIIPDAIKHTEIYRADFPVQFGGRLSSVIDIRARDGNMKKLSGSASLNPISTRFSFEGPFKKDASSYFVSFRLSTIGLLVKAVYPKVERFYFADFTSKFNIRLGQRDRLYLTVFAGKDAFIHKPNGVRNGLEWGNSTGTLRWSHIYGSKLFSNTTLVASKYDFFLYTDYSKKIYWNSNITGTNLKTEFTWYANPRNNIKYGFSLSGYFFNPGNYSSPETKLDTMRVSEVNSGEYVFYIGHEAKLNSWLQMNYGFRLSNWSNYGEAFNIIYDEYYSPVSYKKYGKGVQYYSKSFLEPRISVSFKTGSYSSVKLSYNRTIQNINQINNSISPFNSIEVWLPSGPNIKPQYANIFNIGLITLWPKNALELSADVYYKRMFNQIGYNYHAEMLLNPYLEGELRQGDGYAGGFEIMLKKTQGKFTGQISYAFSRSTLKIKGLNKNRIYLSHQDKPVDISLTFDYKLNPRWTLNVNAICVSGMTISTPSGFYYYRGTQVPYYLKQNNDRLPSYKRVDFGSEWRLNKIERSFMHYFSIAFYNFFNFHNYAFLNFNKIEGNDHKYYVPADKTNAAEQIPTYRYIYSIVPSFTYSLKF
jgi:hypothetical protein